MAVTIGQTATPSLAEFHCGQPLGRPLQSLKARQRKACADHLKALLSAHVAGDDIGTFSRTAGRGSRAVRARPMSTAN